MQEEYIYKIFLKPEYDELSSIRLYSGNERDQEDGFIHFSTHKQTDYIIDKYYKGKDIVLAKIAVLNLNNEKLKWVEKPSGEVFPHYYGSILAKNFEI